jgi:hypothetical protein
MYDYHPAGSMGMGVVPGWSPVGGPSGVADSQVARDRVLGEQILEDADFTLGPPNVYPIAIMHGNTCGIVSAIFESLEAFKEDVGSGGSSDVPDDATHWDASQDYD